MPATGATRASRLRSRAGRLRAAESHTKVDSVSVLSRASLDMADYVQRNAALESGRARTTSGSGEYKSRLSRCSELTTDVHKVTNDAAQEMTDHLLDGIVPVSDVFEQARMELTLANAWVVTLLTCASASHDLFKFLHGWGFFFA
jgi:hypothetical protein